MKKICFASQLQENHTAELVAVVEGLPAGLPVDLSLIDRELERRQWGYGRGGRMKIERDHVEILSGLRHGLTLGSPVTLLIENKDWANWTQTMAQQPEEPIEKPRRVSRPRLGHADLAGGQKYDARDLRNILERASARETAARVACGALARQLLLAAIQVDIRSHVIQLGGLPETPLELTWEEVSAIPDDAPLRCADQEAQERMVTLIDETRRAGDTLGGIFEVIVRPVVPGLGSHTSWDQKLDGRFAQAVMSIPAVKAVEIGAGGTISRLPGSQVHDEIAYDADGQAFSRRTNRAGGLRRRHHQWRRDSRARPSQADRDASQSAALRRYRLERRAGRRL
ncbi:MAG: chorismate synthase [Pyrinomonadaceae bacterium]